MEDMSCPRLLIRTQLITGTQLLSVQVAITPGLYPRPDVYAVPSFYPKYYGMILNFYAFF